MCVLFGAKKYKKTLFVIQKNPIFSGVLRAPYGNSNLTFIINMLAK